MARLVVLGFVLILAGCASHGDPPSAACDGQHRRPANPYGSVLPTAPAPTSATPSSARSVPGPEAAIDPRSFQSCGARA